MGGMLNSVKTALSDALGLSKDALHTHIGLALFVLLTIALRGRPLVPWIAVFMLQLGNEALDILHLHQIAAENVIESIGDTLSTMLWPTAAAIWLRMGRHRQP